jgi:HAD superfamily hydrolase (TIGR01459 family)
MRIDGLAAVAGRFDAMLIDQFGIIHDGRALYPGTRHALLQLKEHGIPVVVMTNSGKRAEANRQRLLRLGIPRDCFVDALSSGELAYQTLNLAPTRGRPLCAYLIGRQGEDYGFDGVTFVTDPGVAEVILILGSNAPETSLEDYRRQLAGLSLPAICCNPDKLMLSPTGLVPAPGAIAALYEEMGGKVTWIGKPHAAIYRHAAALLGNPPRLLCIGDSAEHDVLGGRAAGFSTLLVAAGVSEGLDLARIEPQPDYWMDDFRW